MTATTFAQVPMKTIGPVCLLGPDGPEDVQVPMATYESPLWVSTKRGARATREAGGISAVLVRDNMTRSVVFQAPSATRAVAVAQELAARHDELADAVQQTTNHGRMLGIRSEVVGDLLYVRLEMQTGDAAGHNMVTWAAEHMVTFIANAYADLTYVSISANLCTDKKVSAVNGILGRGKSVIAEVTIPGALCETRLNTTAAAVADLNIKKNLLGSILAGGVRSANAHYANMLLAVYLATGQDAANLVEGSQGITHAEARGDDLYFSVTLPNIIVGTVGNGKELEFVNQNLRGLGCLEDRAPGENAARLARICAATVLCGELSLMAAQTNQGELMRAHRALERKAHG